MRYFLAKSKERGTRSHILYAVFFLLLFSFFGCGSDSEEEEETSTPEEFVKSGWEEYKTVDYGGAILAFEEALTEDGPHLADAYNGLGWVYLTFSQNAIINQKNIATSLSKFQEAIKRDASNSDSWVGQAGLLLIRRSSQNDLQDALKAIDSALQGDASYLYRHDYDSKADLYALKAQCYYYLGELDKARDEVKRVLAIEKNNKVALVIENLLY